MGEAKVERRPITPGMVEVLGSRWSSRELAWAGLRFHEAELRNWPSDPHLGVPWCHPDDDSDGEGDAIYRVRPRDPAWHFVRAKCGTWIMERRNA